MSQPGWYADPSARYQFRWWDGHNWTAQVSSNQVTSTDSNPMEPPKTVVSKLGPEPALPLIETTTGSPMVDPLFSETVLKMEEIGDALFGAFGEFIISSPAKGVLGHVAQTGNRSRRKYELRNAAGVNLANLESSHSTLWILSDGSGRQLGEYTHNQRLGIDMLMPLSVGGDQVAEVKSHDLRGTKLTITDRVGPLATIDRPKGFFADELSTLDEYTMTKHRRSAGFLAYLVLMTPVAIDEARFRRDSTRNTNRTY